MASAASGVTLAQRRMADLVSLVKPGNGGAVRFKELVRW